MDDIAYHLLSLTFLFWILGIAIELLVKKLIAISLMLRGNDDPYPDDWQETLAAAKWPVRLYKKVIGGYHAP